MQQTVLRNICFIYFIFQGILDSIFYVNRSEISSLIFPNNNKISMPSGTSFLNVLRVNTIHSVTLLLFSYVLTLFMNFS